MNKKQLEQIKRKTGHELTEIRQMNDIEFWKHITGALVRGSITSEQHNWLDKTRQNNKAGDSQQTLDALEIFGGKVIK